jgi:hypothetical protein
LPDNEIKCEGNGLRVLDHTPDWPQAQVLGRISLVCIYIHLCICIHNVLSTSTTVSKVHY